VCMLYVFEPRCPFPHAAHLQASPIDREAALASARRRGAQHVAASAPRPQPADYGDLLIMAAYLFTLAAYLLWRPAYYGGLLTMEAYLLWRPARGDGGGTRLESRTTPPG
jgi:hypothetical protein